MSVRSYSDIRAQIGRELDDLSTRDAKEAVIDHLAALTFELNRLKAQQRTLSAALRTRDILLREPARNGAIAPAAPVDLDTREALDVSDGLYDIEWDKETAYRWTGPGHDTQMRVWLDRTIPIVCEIALRSFGDARNKGAIALTVDGVPVAIAEVDDKLLCSGPFPIADGSFYSEIGIHVPWLSAAAGTGDASTEPRSSGGRRRPRAAPAAAEDRRVRGIAFTRVRFLPAG